MTEGLLCCGSRMDKHRRINSTQSHTQRQWFIQRELLIAASYPTTNYILPHHPSRLQSYFKLNLFTNKMRTRLLTRPTSIPRKRLLDLVTLKDHVRVGVVLHATGLECAVRRVDKDMTFVRLLSQKVSNGWEYQVTFLTVLTSHRIATQSLALLQ